MFSSNSTQVSAGGAFIEDVFSTYIYSGQNSNQQIVNNIDTQYPARALVWIKQRTSSGSGADMRHILGYNGFGTNLQLCSNSTAAVSGGQDSGGINAYNTNGFTAKYAWNANEAGATYASWTFKTNPKFFDIVTYTGTGAGNTINHDLGSKPGCIIIKRTNDSGDWFVVSRKADNDYALFSNTGHGLNNTAAANGSTAGGDFSATTINIAALNSSNNINVNGGIYVAYLFAHNAGGFGLTGTDNAISCGAVTGNGTTPNTFVSLGYEPQWILLKDYVNGGSWYIIDNMRGFPVTGGTHPVLLPNSSGAEATGFNRAHPQPTGFSLGNNDANTYIYVAIRRGPMKVPTLGTSVYNAIARTGTGAATTVTGVGFAPDLMMVNSRAGAAGASFNWDRLRGPALYLDRAGPPAEVSAPTSVLSFNMDGISIGTDTNNIINYSVSQTYINWFMKRAAGFFDIVCYTGTGSARTISHNLTVAPEMLIIKSRSAVYSWPTLVTPIGGTDFLFLDSTSAKNSAASYFNNTYPTASVFSVGTNVQVNESGSTFVAYLFATCTGVSKVGSYTGTGTTKQVDCGFSAGARFVLIKRYDGGSTGDWYVWDSVRGIVAGNDPYVRLNLVAAEVTNTDYIDTYNAGFELSSTAPDALNASGGTYIFLAIA